MGSAQMKKGKAKKRPTKLISRRNQETKKIIAQEARTINGQAKQGESAKKEDGVVSQAKDVSVESPPPIESEKNDKYERPVRQFPGSNADIRLGNSPLCATHTREYLILIDDMDHRESLQQEAIRKYVQQFLELIACLHCMAILLTIFSLYAFSQYLMERLKD